MRALVVELERQKYAVTARPRPHAPGKSTHAAPPRETHEAHELGGQARSTDQPEPEPKSRSERESPRRRGRHIPAAIRRAVFARDERRCTYKDDSGQRCRETQGLELHHSRAFARGGAHSLENVTLRCRAHNDLAAEQDFGKGFIERERDSTNHEPWAVHDMGTRDAPSTARPIHGARRRAPDF
jgi:5-methylcytosine-specific restriction endonuclease McrA